MLWQASAWFDRETCEAWACYFTDFLEELPQKLQNEWSSFKKEGIEESERLVKKTNSSQGENTNKPSTKEDLTQAQINKLRSKVIEINKSIEERN